MRPLLVGVARRPARPGQAERTRLGAQLLTMQEQATGERREVYQGQRARDGSHRHVSREWPYRRPYR